jgi:uncharacterized UBP type Zn finger protein
VLVRLAETLEGLGEEGGRGWVDPLPLVQACGRRLGMSEHVLSQNDASELLMRLLDEAEAAPGGEGLGARFRGTQAFSNAHEGCGHVRSASEQPFLVLPLPVKGLGSLAEALEAATAGDDLGARECRQCGATSALRARHAITALPQVLVVQLQRCVCVCTHVRACVYVLGQLHLSVGTPARIALGAAPGGAQ